MINGSERGKRCRSEAQPGTSPRKREGSKKGDVQLGQLWMGDIAGSDSPEDAMMGPLLGHSLNFDLIDY